MKKIVIALSGLFFFGCAKDVKTDYNYKDDTFKVGQKWHYKTRPQDEGSLLTILKIENYATDGIVIHIYVSGLKLKNPKIKEGYSDDAGHSPISKDALLKSVTTLESENNNLPENYNEGYELWKKEYDAGKAGIFSTQVSETIQFVEETVNNSN
jgi:hypothetical protein